MITSLQNFFLKHNKWLFGGLLIVIIVTFVLTIGPQSFFGSGASSQRQSLNYYGYDLTSESDQRAMSYTAEISGILHPELRLRREQLMDYAYLRVAALGMANQLGIPQPDKEQLAEYVESLTIFADRTTGEFSPQAYNQIIQAIQSGGRFDEESIGIVMREDYRIAQVRKALGGPDYSLPHEVRQDFIDRQTNYTIALARFDYGSFSPEIALEEEALVQFFNENPGRYEIQESLSVDALLFQGDAYIEEIADPAESDLQIFFATNSARYQPQPEAGETATEDLPEVTLEEVRDQVIADWKAGEARKLAAKKGEAFSLRLWQESVALDSPEFQTLLDEFKVVVTAVPAYQRDNPPSMPSVPANLLNSMWIYASNPNRYFSDITQNPEGAVILVKRNLTDARMPAFEEVKDRVTIDFTVSEKRRLFAERGNEIHGEITSRLAEESFADIATDLGLTVETLDPFTGAEAPQELVASTIWEQAMFLEAGRLTRMIINGNQGTFAYVAERNAPEIDETSEAFSNYVTRRGNAMDDAMGWARLREITDNSLSQLMGSASAGPQ